MFVPVIVLSPLHDTNLTASVLNVQLVFFFSLCAVIYRFLKLFFGFVRISTSIYLM